MSEITDNRAMYKLGRKYARRADKRPASLSDSVADVADEVGEGVKVVRAAERFARQVNLIAAAVRGAKKTILDGDNPHLTPKNIALIAKLKADGMKSAMAKAARGLHPFAPNPPDGLSAELAPWHFDLSRLHTATAILQRIGDLPACRLGNRELDDLFVHATAIRANVEALKLVVGRGKRGSRSPESNGQSGDRSKTVGSVKSARALVEAVTGDMLRAAHACLLDSVRAILSRAVTAVGSEAERILSVLPTRTKCVPAPIVKPNPGGTFDLGGTYVVVFRARKSDVVRLGALGTFCLPAGYLLYVGSAFGPGGVARRTDRHLRGSGPQLWNVDFLRGFAEPAELWWTHHHGKVECDWAMALASMPQCCAPAPRAGARDCKRCPTHLYRMKDRPSVAGFAEQLGLRGSCGYEINWQSAAHAIGSQNRAGSSGELVPISLFG
jgi:Uri superfamily endonuclease